jgi:hypothetical protein
VLRSNVKDSTDQLTLGEHAPEAAVTALERSRPFNDARAAAAKDRVPAERFTAILIALDGAAGSRLLLDALARRTGITPMRLRGTLATMRRHLNVEGYDVLSLNDETGDVVLDVALLHQQFEVDAG